jgi:hypothetical protein
MEHPTNSMHAGGRKNRKGAVQLTLGGYQRKSKLQKEYADRAPPNHKPVNSLRKRLRELSGYFFHDWLCSVQKLLKN